MTPNIAVPLRQARRRAGLTQDQLAAKAQVDRMTISNIERDKVKSCDADTLLKLCEILPELYVYLMPAPHSNYTQGCIQYTSHHIYTLPLLADTLYHKIMAANTIDDCDAIADEVLATTPWLDAYRVGLINPCIDKERLSGHFTARLKQFYELGHIYLAILQASKHTDNQDIVAHAFALAEAHGIGPTYMLDTTDTDAHSDLITICYCAAINQYVCIHSYDLEDYWLFEIDPDGAMTRSEIIADFLENGIYTTIDDYARDFIRRFIAPKLDNIMGLNNGHICYKSLDIMPALYQMLLLPSSSDGEQQYIA